MIRLVVGLGNPGERYARTRHNVGCWLVDRLAAAHGATFRAEPKFQGETCRIAVPGQEVALLKPSTYMNRSGGSVGAYARYHKIEAPEILVVHDELDLEPGTVRLKRGGGHGGHNGLRDLCAHLGPDFLRLRIGIGKPASAAQGADYVLAPPGADDHAAIERAIERALEEFPAVLADGGFDQAMNRLNRRTDQ